MVITGELDAGLDLTITRSASRFRESLVAAEAVSQQFTQREPQTVPGKRKEQEAYQQS
jgi:hypothetical protein